MINILYNAFNELGVEYLTRKMTPTKKSEDLIVIFEQAHDGMDLVSQATRTCYQSQINPKLNDFDFYDTQAWKSPIQRTEELFNSFYQGPLQPSTLENEDLVFEAESENRELAIKWREDYQNTKTTTHLPTFFHQTSVSNLIQILENGVIEPRRESLYNYGAFVAKLPLTNFGNVGIAFGYDHLSLYREASHCSRIRDIGFKYPISVKNPDYSPNDQVEFPIKNQDKPWNFSCLIAVDETSRKNLKESLAEVGLENLPVLTLSALDNHSFNAFCREVCVPFPADITSIAEDLFREFHFDEEDPLVNAFRMDSFLKSEVFKQMPKSRLLEVLIHLQHVDLIKHFLAHEDQPFDQWSASPFSLFKSIENAETRYQILEVLAAHPQFNPKFYLTYMTKSCDVINEKEFLFLLDHPSQDFKKYGETYQAHLASQLIEHPTKHDLIEHFQTLLHEKIESQKENNDLNLVVESRMRSLTWGQA